MTLDIFAVIAVFQCVFCYDRMQSVMLLQNFLCLLFYVIHHNYLWAKRAQSVQRLAIGWTFRESNPVFRTCPDLPLGPPSLLYNVYCIIPGGRAAGAWH